MLSIWLPRGGGLLALRKRAKKTGAKISLAPVYLYWIEN
jgi:hypothetical protein